MKTKKNFFVVLLAVIAMLTMNAAITHADTYVDGYYRSDGTYVRGHWRSSPDRSYNNNWSTKPNRNPYTDKKGYRSPTWNDKSPKKSGYHRY